MSDGRLFDLDEIPEVPIFREPRRAEAARGSILDGRFKNEYPPDWHRCGGCVGTGWATLRDDRSFIRFKNADGTDRGDCRRCLAMGSIKARVRFEQGHRCERCGHPYVPKGDAKMLGVEPTSYRWSPCKASCTHAGPVRVGVLDGEGPELLEWWETTALVPTGPMVEEGQAVEAEWRILTVHHLDGDKANCRWWNLAALCQRCHLEIQAKVVLERIYPHEHTPWFQPHAAGWYAFAYLSEELTREETLASLDDLLALERAA